jgi:N-methylhydantoinase B
VPRSTDIFSEGLQLRSVKLWKKGEPIEEVYRIIENNTREPVELMGDIAAQLAGCLLGRDLTAALAEKYGVDTYLAALQTILDQSEEAARAWIRSLPDGTYTAEAFLDNDGEGDKPIPIAVTVIVDGDEMTIDYSNIADQVPGCINSGYYGGGRTTARVAFTYLLGNGEPANEGTFRPLKLILPPGKILSAAPDAPMGNYSQPFPTAIDVIIRALSPAVPDRAPAGHYATFSGFRFTGKTPDGKPFDNHANGYGGWGAFDGHDGAGPFRTMAHGDTRIIPMELQEALYPMMVENFSLRPDSGGAGKFRGGLGVDYVYRTQVPCKLVVKFDRIDCPPWGVSGGKDGVPGWVTVHKPDGSQQILRKTKGYALGAGDVVHVEIGGGGGWGDPKQRVLDRVQRDLDRGYVTPEGAQRDYGISISADGRAYR